MQNFKFYLETFTSLGLYQFLSKNLKDLGKNLFLVLKKSFHLGLENDDFSKMAFKFESKRWTIIVATKPIKNQLSPKTPIIIVCQCINASSW